MNVLGTINITEKQMAFEKKPNCKDSGLDGKLFVQFIAVILISYIRCQSAKRGEFGCREIDPHFIAGHGLKFKQCRKSLVIYGR